MRVDLIPFPDSKDGCPVERLVASLLRTAEGVELVYELKGDPSRIASLALKPSHRGHDLWTTTCFECFLMRPERAGYIECNLAPSTEWAVYSLSGYREGFCESDAALPRLAAEVAPDGLTLRATLALDKEAFAPTAPIRAALSAVIEATNGETTYWALAHPSDEPDFHHPDSFTLRIPPLEAA